jgi:NACHT domain
LTILGKTILASLIVDECQKSSASTAYFYCKEDEDKRNDATSVFTGLLTQLIPQSRNFEQCRSLIPYCHEKSSTEISPSPKTAEDLLTYFCNTFPSLFFIIDGLDECEQEKRKQILGHLNKIVTMCDKQSPGKVRVLFVSRDLPDIKAALPTSTCFDLQNKDTVDDIKNYVKFRAEIVRKQFHLTLDQESEMVENVVTKSEGQSIIWHSSV